MENKTIIILRTRQCRRSDLIIKFLQAEKIPHVVKSLETDPEAQRLAQKFDLRSSPGIIVNGQVVNPYQMIENCQIKDRVKARQLLEDLLKK
jgi:glutaredoxin